MAIEAIDENNECLADIAKMEAIVSFFLYLGAQDVLDGGSHARLFASSAAYFEQHIAMVLRKTSATIKPAKVVELLKATCKLLQEANLLLLLG